MISATLLPLLSAPVKLNYFATGRRLTCSALKLILAWADRDVRRIEVY